MHSEELKLSGSPTLGRFTLKPRRTTALRSSLDKAHTRYDEMHFLQTSDSYLLHDSRDVVERPERGWPGYDWLANSNVAKTFQLGHLLVAVISADKNNGTVRCIWLCTQSCVAASTQHATKSAAPILHSQQPKSPPFLVYQESPPMCVKTVDC